MDLNLSEAAADSLLCLSIGWLLRLLSDDAERVLPVSWLRLGLSVRHSWEQLAEVLGDSFLVILRYAGLLAGVAELLTLRIEAYICA